MNLLSNYLVEGFKKSLVHLANDDDAGKEVSLEYSNSWLNYGCPAIAKVFEIVNYNAIRDA